MSGYNLKERKKEKREPTTRTLYKEKPDSIRDKGRCAPIGNRDNSKKKKT